MKTIAGCYIPLLLDVFRNRERYLARNNLNDLQAFMSGYSNGLNLFQQIQPSEEGKIWNEFERYVAARYPSAASIYLSVYPAGISDTDAWALFFGELQTFLGEVDLDVRYVSFEKSKSSLEEYLKLQEALEERPWMYLGCASLSLFSIFTEGVLFAESMCSDMPLLKHWWQAFGDSLTNFGGADWRCSWPRRCLMMASFDEKRAWEMFLERIRNWRARKD